MLIGLILCWLAIRSLTKARILMKSSLGIVHALWLYGCQWILCEGTILLVWWSIWLLLLRMRLSGKLLWLLAERSISLRRETKGVLRKPLSMVYLADIRSCIAFGSMRV